MLRKTLCIGLLAALFAPAVAMAQFDAGDWELTLSGSGASDNEFDDNFIGFDGSLGYFFNDNLEAGVRQGIDIASVQGADDDFGGSTRVFADWHFDLDRWQPFLGANIGYLYGDLVHDTWIASPEAGLKWFANRTTFIYGMVEYQFFFDEADEADEAFNDGQWVYTLGIGFKW